MIAKAKVSGANVSFKHSLVLCREVRGESLKKAKELLKGLIEGSVSINGKFYTKAAKKVLEVLLNVEANAKQKGMNTEKLFVKTARAEKGDSYLRPRSLWRLRGQTRKSTNIYVEVEER